MGRLINGRWVKGSIVTSDEEGAYDRLTRTFRDYISHDHPVYKPELNRYHLYVSYACPWACRTLIYRHLKGLEDYVSVSVVHPDMLDNGWYFSTEFSGSTHDHINGFSFLREVYQWADPYVNTSVTVPILWDIKTQSIVNNESSEIIRIFNSRFDELTGNAKDYYPAVLRDEIDELNKLIYHGVNNGVYKVGFAKNQSVYDRAVKELFETLDTLEKRLETRKYLLGIVLTEADIRLIPTLLRFDLVYYVHFKCNYRRIKDYPNLHRYMKDLYQIPAIKAATNFDHIKRHYYFSHKQINPYRIVPTGPEDIF